MAGPEDNPLDNEQPTKEEWEEYEQQQRDSLVLHLELVDRWERMSDRERDERIKWAMENPS